jgi:hypothetical protein
MLARAVDAECVAECCHHDYVIAGNVLYGVVARVFTIGDDFA